MKSPARLVVALLAIVSTSLAAACSTPTDPQCIADLESNHGTPCGAASQCARGLICSSVVPGQPTVCHAPIACSSSAECRGVRFCGVAALCTPNATGVNLCLPMGFVDDGGGAADAETDGAMDATSDATATADVASDVANDTGTDVAVDALEGGE
jgi:hypothetical protein